MLEPKCNSAQRATVVHEPQVEHCHTGLVLLQELQP